MELIEFKGKSYPKFQSEGNAAQFALPFAKHVCKGTGVDVGYMKPEWKFPGSIGIDEGKFHNDQDGYQEYPDLCSATQFDVGKPLDYVFSSHCLEHLNDWVDVLNYWHSKLKPEGLLFLYLPNADDQIYWRPWHNRKHVNYLTPEIMKSYFSDLPEMWSGYQVTESDPNSSFYAMATKA